MGVRDPRLVLMEIIELTELESSLIAAVDADAILLLCEERGELFDELPPSLPDACRPLVERFEVVRAANEAAATVAAAAIRAELGGVSASRTAVAAYGSGGRPRAFDGEG